MTRATGSRCEGFAISAVASSLLRERPAHAILGAGTGLSGRARPVQPIQGSFPWALGNHSTCGTYGRAPRCAALLRFYRQVFPDDWQPDLEPSRSHTIWPISLPEGSRLVRLASVVRRLPAAQRLEVQTALVNAGLSGGEVHEFDTYTEMFLGEGDVDKIASCHHLTKTRAGGRANSAKSKSNASS
jgi:hypothetical protein